MSTPPRKSLFERLQQGLQEGIAYQPGETTLRTTTLPDKPPEFDAATLIALRTRSAMSQVAFARLLNVSTKTIQSWEQGRRRPADATRRLLQIYTRHPEIVCQTVGVPYEIRN